MITVRKAIPSDLPNLIAMGREFYQCSGYWQSGVEFDARTFADTISKLSLSEDSAILVASLGGEAIGMIAATSNKHWLNASHRVGHEVFWWVDPCYRTTKAGSMLIDEIERWAQQVGCKVFCVCSTATLKPKALDRLYRRRGYVPYDHIYARSL